MPIPLLNAHLRQLPRLEASESLRRVSEVNLATAPKLSHAHKRVLREWEATVAGGEPTRPRLSMGWLAGMGIAVERVPVERADA